MAVRKEEVRVTADVSNFVTKMATAGAAASGFASRLEEADGRMANLVQSGLALAPALVPLGAAAVPAVAGLATQLGFAALAAGTAVLAFQGVGDGLKALNAYQINPTAANFAKLQQAMDKLGPAGQEFVLTLDKMEPALNRLKAVAQQGLLPGVTTGLEDILRLAPQVQQVVFATATTMGDMFREGAANVSGGALQDFFNFLNTDARPILTDMGKALGNFGLGLANMVVAFGPMSVSFSDGLVKMSQAFRDWTDGLAQSTSFQDFISYVEKSGPMALDAIGAIVKALASIVEAAAPIGSVALPAITAVANAIAGLAGSGAGTAIVAVAAAVGILGRSLALLNTVGLRGGEGGNGFLQRNYVAPSKGVVTAFREMRTASEELRVAEERRAHAAINAGSITLAPSASKRAAIDEYNGALLRQEEASRRVAEAERTRSAALREGAASFGKAAAGVAGLTLATSGIADSTGLANTASLALLGTIAGPWGAAIGGGIGLVQDMAAANNDLETAVSAAGRAFAGQAVDFTTQGALLNAARSSFEKYSSSVAKGNAKVNPFDPSTYGNLSSPGDAFRALADKFTHSGEEAKKSTDSMLSGFIKLRTGAAQVFADLNHGSRDLFGGTDQQLADFTAKITPALQRAGIGVKDFLNAADGSNLRLTGLDAIRSYFADFDSASGKSRAVADALKGLGSQMTDTASAASSLKSSMDSLFGVQLTQSAATDAWTQNLRDLRKEIAGTNGAIEGTSSAALKNREAIRGSVTALEAKVNADAAAGVSGDKLVGSLISGRNAIIRQAVAAGASRKAVKGYLDTLNLTPKNLATIITQPGLLNGKQQVQALTRLYHLTPKQVHTLIAQAGMDRSQGAIKRLAALYHITPKQVRTLLIASDHASSVVRGALIRLREFDGQTATATIRVVTQRQVVSIPGITKPRANQADGGVWSGRTQVFDSGGFTDSGQYVPRVPQMRQGGGNVLWSEPETGWEAYISGKPSQKARNLDVWRQAGDRLGARFVEYANGGLAVDSLRYASNVAPVAQSASSGPATFHLYDQGGSLIGTMRGVARDEAASALDGSRRQDAMNRRARRGN